MADILGIRVPWELDGRSAHRSGPDRVVISDEAMRTLLERYDPAPPFVPSPLPGRISGGVRGWAGRSPSP